MTEAQMMATGYVFFVALIFGEAAWSAFKADGRYRIGEASVNIGHGMVFQVWDSFTKAWVLVPFVLVSHLVTWSVLPTDAWWGWLLGLLAYDFAGYWAHRHHHEIHLLWGIHAAHHAAEDFNFAAALRQAVFQNLFRWAWKMPLALVMPLEMLIGLVVFDYLYQFLMHTQYVPKLGPVEWVMNTPSHHRVHHGRNERYLDKNYGGILIIWDRLFGTFQVEDEVADFGITRPLHSLNPVWGNLAVWAELVDASRLARGRDKLWLWLRGPAHLSRLAPGLPAAVPSRPIENADLPFTTLASAVLNLGVGTSSLGWLMYAGGSWPLAARLALGAWVVATTLCIGARIEGRSWASAADAVRTLVGVIGFGLAVHPVLALPLVALFALGEAGRPHQPALAS